MRRGLWFAVLLSGCRFLAPAQTPVTAARPYEPGARPEVPAGNRCGVECGPGFTCDQATATCVAVPVASGGRDAGAPWLP